MEKKPKYNSLSEWRKAEPKAYQAAYLSGMIDSICETFGWKKVTAYKWSEEAIMLDALKYTSLAEWHKKSAVAYMKARKNETLFAEATKHMVRKIIPWTKERCIESARKYNTRTEWQKNCNSYQAASKQPDWMNECTTHMVYKQKPNDYWTKERCIEDAKNYTRYNDWVKNSQSYRRARDRGILDECSSHMIRSEKPKGYWTKERVLAEARKYKNKPEWKNSKNASSYNIAISHGWWKEATAHMEFLERPKGYWKNKENVLAEARKFSSKSEWWKDERLNGFNGYSVAHKNGWMDECIKAMKDNDTESKKR